MPQITFPLLLLWIALCAWQDLRQQRIDNRLTYPALLLVLGWLLIQQQGFTGQSLAAALSGLVLALAFALPGQIKGVFGGGDVKLLLTIGIATDGLYILWVITFSALGIVLWLFLRSRLSELQRQRLQCLAPGLASEPGPLAYAPFVLLASLATCLMRL